MGKAEETIKKILNDIKTSGFEYEIPKDELIKIISKYSLNPYPYINRLWADGYIEEISPKLYRILK